MIDGQAKSKTMPENMSDQSPEAGQNGDTNADFNVNKPHIYVVSGSSWKWSSFTRQ